MIKQSQSRFPRFVIGLVLPLLLTTPTTKFLLDRKQRNRKQSQNAVFNTSLSSTLLITTPTPTPSLIKTSPKVLN